MVVIADNFLMSVLLTLYFLFLTVIALVRVLMRSRSELTYLTLFRYLKTLAPNLEPQSIHCDFEKATMNALRTVFPTSSIVGCLWHYGVVSLDFNY